MLTASVLEIAALNYIIYSWQFINNAIIQGLGRPQVSSVMILVCSYLVALPAQLILAF